MLGHTLHSCSNHHSPQVALTHLNVESSRESDGWLQDDTFMYTEWLDHVLVQWLLHDMAQHCWLPKIKTPTSIEFERIGVCFFASSHTSEGCGFPFVYFGSNKVQFERGCRRLKSLFDSKQAEILSKWKANLCWHHQKGKNAFLPNLHWGNCTSFH